MELTAGKIAEILSGEVEGDKDATVTTFARIESGKPGAISFSEIRGICLRQQGDNNHSKQDIRAEKAGQRDSREGRRCIFGSSPASRIRHSPEEEIFPSSRTVLPHCVFIESGQEGLRRRFRIYRKKGEGRRFHEGLRTGVHR